MLVKTRKAEMHFDSDGNYYDSSQCPFCNRRSRVYGEKELYGCVHLKATHSLDSVVYSFDTPASPVAIHVYVKMGR